MEAKKMIDELPHNSVKNLIYRKGLINFLPQKISSLVKDNIQDNSEAMKISVVNDAASHSGSTRSDDVSKNLVSARRFSFDESEEGSPTHHKKRKKAAESFSNNFQIGGQLGKSTF
jgi:hypothetical protein